MLLFFIGTLPSLQAKKSKMCFQTVNGQECWIKSPAHYGYAKVWQVVEYLQIVQLSAHRAQLNLYNIQRIATNNQSHGKQDKLASIIDKLSSFCDDHLVWQMTDLASQGPELSNILNLLFSPNASSTRLQTFHLELNLLIKSIQKQLGKHPKFDDQVLNSLDRGLECLRMIDFYCALTAKVLNKMADEQVKVGCSW